MKRKNGITFKKNKNNAILGLIVLLLLVVTGILPAILELVFGLVVGGIALVVGLAVGLLGLVVGLIGGGIGLAVGLLPIVLPIAIVYFIVQTINSDGTPKRKNDSDFI